MRVLGIDPGSRHLGWGLLVRQGTRIEHVAHGVIDVDTSGTFAGRLVEIDDELGKVIASLATDAAAVESLFFAKDAQSAATLWTIGVDFIQGNFVQHEAQNLDYDFRAATG